MRKILIGFLLIYPSLLFGQDRIVGFQKQSMACFITRVTLDTIFFDKEDREIFMLRSRIKKIYSEDEVKKFICNNPQFYGSENLGLEYTNYSINKFRMQSNIGRVMMLGGGIISGLSIFAYNKNYHVAQSTALVGGLISIVGYWVEWNSLHWLANLNIETNYQLGVGYTFKF